MRPDVLRVRRAVRALIRQGGGVMLSCLPGAGDQVRIECAVVGGRAELTVRCDGVRVPDASRRAVPGIRAECERAGLELGVLRIVPWHEPAAVTDLTEARDLLAAA